MLRGVTHRESAAVSLRRFAPVGAAAEAEGRAEQEGGGALPLPDVVADSLVPDDIRDVPGRDVGVAQARLFAAGRRAVAAVAEAGRVGGAAREGEGAEGGVEGAQRGGVSVRAVGGVRRRVAEASVLGDGGAACGKGIEGGGEGGEVGAAAGLGSGEEDVGGEVRGVAQAVIGQGGEPRAAARLRAADEARALAVADGGGGGVGGVEGAARLPVSQPFRARDDT